MGYSGPVIDVHHHLWDLGMQRHHWLGQSSSSLNIVGDSRYLSRNYLPADFSEDIAGQGVVASVHDEAHWDRARDGIEETLWLETLDRPDGIAARYVVWAELAKTGAPERLERHAQCSSRVVGVRESIREHSDPAYAYAGSANWRDAAWQEGVAALSRRGWLLELLIYPHQAPDVRALARLFPELTIVVNHSASPIGTGPQARRQFRDAIAMLAEAPNIVVKGSNFFRYSPDLTFEACIAEVFVPLVETFGAGRLMFASDFPVASKWTTYDNLMRSVRSALSAYPAELQQEFFHDTARRVYRIDAA